MTDTSTTIAGIRIPSVNAIPETDLAAQMIANAAK